MTRYHKIGDRLEACKERYCNRVHYIRDAADPYHHENCTGSMCWCEYDRKRWVAEKKVKRGMKI